MKIWIYLIFREMTDPQKSLYLINNVITSSYSIIHLINYENRDSMLITWAIAHDKLAEF